MSKIDRPDFAAAITADELQGSLNVRKGWFQVHRLALKILTRSSAELVEISSKGNGAEALLELLTNLGDYLEWRKAETEILEGALARVTLVLLAPDKARAAS